MTAKVNEVCIGDDFLKCSLVDFEVIINERDGFFNASLVCPSRGKKTLGKYKKYRETLRNSLKEYYSGRDIMYENKGNPNSSLAALVKGWFFHPALFLDLAAWLGPKVYVSCAIILKAYLNEKECRRWQLSELLTGEKIKRITKSCWKLYPTYQLDLDVNERGWIQGKNFCNKTNLSLCDVEGCDECTRLVNHLKRIDLYNKNSEYYHPLLLLRVAVQKVDVFLLCARTIFCCGDKCLSGLFQEAIHKLSEYKAEMDEEELDEELKKVYEEVMECEEELDEDDVDNDEPNARMGYATFQNPVTPHLQVQRQTPKPVKREAIKKDTPMTVELEKGVTPDSAARRRPSKNNDVEPGPSSSRDLKPMTQPVKRKRLNKEGDGRDANPNVKNVGELECLVLFETAKKVIHFYNLQCQDLVATIRSELNKINRFVGWFLLRDGHFDFNHCAKLVQEEVAKDECEAKILSSQRMKLDNENKGNFILPAASVAALRLHFDFIEADIKKLGRLFKKFVCPVNVAVDEKLMVSSSISLGDVHRWIEDNAESSWTDIEGYIRVSINSMNS